MKITISDVGNIAELARLELSDKEKSMYAEQLSAVLDYVNILNEVDTEGVEETNQVTGLMDVVRPDEVKDCDDSTRKKIISQFPDTHGDLLKVKAVFD